MARLYKGNEIKYHTGIKVPDGTIKEITFTFYTDEKASFTKTYSKNEIAVKDGKLVCNITKEDTLMLNEGVLNCRMESSVVRDDFPDTFDAVFVFNTPFYLKDAVNPTEIKYQAKTVTANGTYKADDGYVALSTVNVELPLEDKEQTFDFISLVIDKFAEAIQTSKLPTDLEILPTEGNIAMSSLTLKYDINFLQRVAMFFNEGADMAIECIKRPSNNLTITTNGTYTVYNGITGAYQMGITQSGDDVILTEKNTLAVDGYKAVTVNVPSKEEETKTVSYSSNGSYTVTPTEGKSISSVNVTVDVPAINDIMLESVNLSGVVTPARYNNIINMDKLENGDYKLSNAI